MRDFNFFAPYQVVVEKKSSSTAILMAVAAGLLAICVAFVLINSISIMSSKRTIANMENAMNDPQFKAKIARVEEKQKELSSLKSDKIFFENLNTLLDNQNKVNEAGIRLISEQVPDNLSITELKITGDIVDIKGKANNKVAVAQFQYNLRETGVFDNLFVSEMKQELDKPYFNFIINLQAKGAATDEN